MEILPLIMFPAFAILAVGLIVFGIIQARKRREAMQRLAADLEFDFYADDPWDLPGRYGFFDLFQHGHSKRVSNILCGEIDGRAVSLFDYRYKTGSGKNQSTHNYQAAVLGLPINAANLRMRSENILDRVASWVGYDDIDFESDEFSRRYHVACTDRRFAYDILHTRLIAYLLRCDRAPELEMSGPLMLLHESPGGPENCRRLLAIGREIVDSIPDYVLKARGVPASGGEPT